MNRDTSIRSVVHIALFAALIAVLGLIPPIAVPLVPVPITAQTLGVMLSGVILGARKGALANILVILLVAVGLPILSGGRGGFAVFQGPTIGFLLAWPLGAYVAGWIVEKSWDRLNILHAFGAAAVGGVLVIYAVGIPVLSIVAGIPLAKAAVGSAAFIPGDIIKAIIAAIAAVTVKKGYPMIRVA